MQASVANQYTGPGTNKFVRSYENTNIACVAGACMSSRAQLRGMQGHVLARTTNRYANICVPHMCLHSYGFNTVCFEGFMGSPGKSPGNKHDQVRHQKTVIERTRTCTRTSRTCTCIRTHHAERHVGTPMNIHASSYHPDNDKHDHGSDDDENVKKRSRDMSSHFRM